MWKLNPGRFINNGAEEAESDPNIVGSSSDCGGTNTGNEEESAGGAPERRPRREGIKEKSIRERGGRGGGRYGAQEADKLANGKLKGTLAALLLMGTTLVS